VADFSPERTAEFVGIRTHRRRKAGGVSHPGAVGSGARRRRTSCCSLAFVPRDAAGRLWTHQLALTILEPHQRIARTSVAMPKPCPDDFVRGSRLCVSGPASVFQVRRKSRFVANGMTPRSRWRQVKL
jgi:hypothetical protein